MQLSNIEFMSFSWGWYTQEYTLIIWKYYTFLNSVFCLFVFHSSCNFVQAEYKYLVYFVTKSLQKSVTKCVWTCISPDAYNQENIFRNIREQVCTEHTNTHVQCESRDSTAGAPLLFQTLFSIVQVVSRRNLTAEGSSIGFVVKKVVLG